MTRDRLADLSDLNAPAPSDESRRAALQSALAAFDEAAAEKTGTRQGTAIGRRPIVDRIIDKGRKLMTLTPFNTPVAATILILPAAALLAYQVTREYRFDSPPVADLREQVAAKNRSADPDGYRSAERLRQIAVGEEAAGQPVRPPVALNDAESVAPAPATGLENGAAVSGPAPARVGRTESRTDKAEAEEVDSTAPATNESFASSTGQPAAPAEPLARVRKGADIQIGAKQTLHADDNRAAPGVVLPVPVDPQIAPESTRDSFQSYSDRTVKSVKAEPVSTFSIDVDTASYAFVRRALHGGTLPPADAVRVEEMINYFDYGYAAPTDTTTPFATHVAIYPTPWNPDTRLMHIGIQAYDIDADDRPGANLVFLIDVSGSMNQPDKLPLLKSAFRMLLNELRPHDTVSIVTYAGHAGTVLEPTPASRSGEILRAIDQLRPGGSTAGAAGIEEAYRLAEAARIDGGTNRVILATDGDFNVGISDLGALKAFIENKRRSGIFLSVLGFGQGNYRDDLMQTLAQNGNGVAAYIDTLNEARKVLVDEAGSALFTVAKDVKIQVEFNPATVSEYRLVGYETRALNREDFNNDRVDAGDIGAGHAVTAIYEITPAGSPAQLIDDLRYATGDRDERSDAAAAGTSDEYAFLKLRYKLPGESRSIRVDRPITTAVETETLAGQGDDIRFAAAVAAFGQKLRGNRAVDNYGYDAIAALANGARGDDRFGYRGELVSLVRLAESLDRR